MRRIRLSTLMLLIVIAALSIVVVVQQQRAARREAELRIELEVATSKNVITLDVNRVELEAALLHSTAESKAVKEGDKP
jgi:hypothetical protein